MDRIDCKDRYICLVLACRRPFYEARRKANEQTFNILKSCGFIIVYVYSDNSLSSIKSTRLDSDTYELNVPAPEIYDLLTYKINLAYDYFNKNECKGILKIDDNTQIMFPEIIEHDFMELTTQYDYIGLQKIVMSKDKTPYIHLENRTVISLLENIHHKIDCNFYYFAGPFYYVSKKAINQITNNGLQFLYEDMAVGYVINKDAKLKRYLWPFKDRGVSWDNLSEKKTYIRDGK